MDMPLDEPNLPGEPSSVPPAPEPSRRLRNLRGIRAVVIDDDDATLELLEAILTREDMEVDSFTEARSGLARVTERPPHVVLTDLEMQGLGGLEVVEELARSHPDVPVIVITGHADLEHAVGALRAGAYDFLTKPLSRDRVLQSLLRASEHHYLSSEVRRLRHRVAEHDGFGRIIGNSPSIQRVFDLISRIAPTDASVLVTGESGTGKELVARAMHERSERSDGEFVAINCAAVPANLIESELFGHVKGAFTDARTDRQGLFAKAEGGTLFLDEVGEIPLEMQPKLLRALQERKIRPVGGDREIELDVRIVAATNRNLLQAVEAGDFREDLYYRVNVVGVELPPLRERGNDVLTLAQHFAERIGDRYRKPIRGLRSDAARAILDYPWPGNVRELENAMDRAVALTRYDQITADDLPPPVREHEPKRLPVQEQAPEALITLGELETRYIRRVLEAVEGNKSKAARVLGIDRRTLYRKLARLEEGEEEE